MKISLRNQQGYIPFANEFSAFMLSLLTKKSSGVKYRKLISKGYTLLELMISLLLSCLVMSFLFRQVLGIERQADTIFNKINETLEYAWLSDFMRMHIQRAGYTPCRRLDELSLIDKRFLPEPVTSFESTPNHIQFRYMKAETQGLGILDANTLIVRPQAFNLKYPILIADCLQGEVHRLAKIVAYPTYTLLILQEPLQYSYERDFYVGEWATESFFIKQGEGKRKTLFYKQHHTDEISPYVHRLSGQSKKLGRQALIELTLGWGRQQKKWVIRSANR